MAEFRQKPEQPFYQSSSDQPAAKDPRQALFEAQQREMFWRGRLEGLRQGPVMRLLDQVRKGNLEELSREENKEIARAYLEAFVTLWGGVDVLAKDARTHFSPQVWPVLRQEETVAGIMTDLRAAIAAYGVEQRSGGDLGYTSRLSADLNRLLAFTVMLEHAFGPMELYYEGKAMQGILTTGKRLKVMSIDDMRGMFGSIKDPDLLPVNLDKLPEVMKEGMAEKVRKYCAEMIYFEMAIAAMNRYNPEKPKGQEMSMRISDTTREFLARTFTAGGENRAGSITIGGKKFDIHLLSYYTTVESEQDRKRYEALMQAMVVEGVYSKLRKFPEDLGLIDTNPDIKTEFEGLIERVRARASQIIERWDSPRGSVDQRAASWAFDLNYFFNVGTLNINDLAHYYHWKYDEKNRTWSFVDEVGDPDTALDSVNSWLAILHEITYRTKGRVTTPLLPPTDYRFIEGMINYVGSGGRDPEIVGHLRGNEHLARGAGIIGIFEKELQDRPAWKEGARKRRELGRSFNPAALVALEQTIWGLPTSIDGMIFPMPIKPFFDSVNLLNALSADKKTTLLDELRGGRTIAEIDFEKYHPFGPDGWQASNKMIVDIITMFYGMQDPKYLEQFFASPSSGIGNMIKKLDIGTRNEVWVLRDESGNEIKWEPKKFFEITYTSYMIWAYLFLYSYGLWDGHRKWEVLGDDMWRGKLLIGGKAGYSDFIEAAAFLPKEKQSFVNYSDSFVLLLYAMFEWGMAIAKRADSSYVESIGKEIVEIQGDLMPRRLKK